MTFPGHPLHGKEFFLLGKRECKDGLYYGVELPDQSAGYLPAKWFRCPSEQDVAVEEATLLASVDAIRKMLSLISHLEKRTPPNVE